MAVSGDDALQREQVCKAGLLYFYNIYHVGIPNIVPGIVPRHAMPAKAFVQHLANWRLLSPRYFSVYQSDGAG